MKNTVVTIVKGEKARELLEFEASRVMYQAEAKKETQGVLIVETEAGVVAFMPDISPEAFGGMLAALEETQRQLDVCRSQLREANRALSAEQLAHGCMRQNFDLTVRSAEEHARSAKALMEWKPRGGK